MNILCTLLCVMLLTVLPATAQNTNEDKNKAIIETNDGSQELNTDDIQLIRFDGGKVTVVHSEGETTYDRTLRSLSFQRPNPGTLRLTATTSIATEDSGNRAQTIDGGNLKSTWEEGDQVYVYATENTTTSIGTLTPKEADWGKSTATLTGSITSTGLTDGQTLYFSTKDRSTLNLSSQDGRVESLFYFTATGTITIDNANASISNLTFERPIAIVKFTLKDKTDATLPVYAKSFTVNDGTNTYIVTPTTATNELFVGIPGISSKTITLTATDGLSSYNYEKTGVSFLNNEYYAINVKMNNTTDYLTVPLTFEAKEAKATVTFTETTTLSLYPLEYNVYDGEGWKSYTSGTEIPLANAGDKVSFRGNNATYATGDAPEYGCNFSCTAGCYVYGNIMSLVDEDNFATTTTLTANFAFAGLFARNDYLYNHADKTLLLPATTLSYFCYINMFFGCTGLTTAPELPATTLLKDCYNGMFSGCTSLTKAPVLPATTLAEGCYYIMFQGCENLNSVTCFATDISAEGCTKDWLGVVAATGTFFRPESMTSWKTNSADGIPSGWAAKDAMLATPLTFEAKTAGAQVTFTKGSSVSLSPLEYSTDGATWREYTSGTAIALTKEGDKVSFRGTNVRYANSTSDGDYSYFSCSDDCYLYGNIMSLINKTGYATATALTRESAFCKLFKGNTHIVSHPSETLLLPATTLTNNCYSCMFEGCTGLTSAPELPATTLAVSCYSDMFNGCTSLTKAPTLPAATLTGCTSLEKVEWFLL